MSKYLILMFLVSTNALSAQSYDLTEELGEYLSDYIPQSEEEPVDQQFWEDIKVININNTSFHELRNIPWLTVNQIHNLLEYLKQNGPMVSLYELQAVPGWDLSTIRLTQSLMKINRSAENFDARNFQEQIMYDGGIEMLVRTKRRLQLARGYTGTDKSGFQGAPWYWLASLRYRKKGTFDLGIRAEKDPGEKFNWKPASGLYGADHISMFLTLENKGPFKRILIGDFTAQWDQGLILGRGLGFRKQVITGPRRVHSGIAPHTGTREFGYQQGIGMEIQLGNFLISAIYSRRLLDAQILPGDTIYNLSRRIPAIIETGLHRTPAEMDRRKTSTQKVAGLHLQKSWSSNLVTSLSTLYQKFYPPWIPDYRRYNYDAFRGSQNINFSVGVEYLWKNLNFYSQFATSSSKGWGTLAGLTTSLSHNFSMTLHFRKYTRDFHGIFGSAFGVNSQNNNEQGFYWAFQYIPMKKWVIGYYNDIYKTAGPTFSIDAQANSMDQLLRLQYIPNKKGLIDIYMRLTKSLLNTPIPGKFTHDLTNADKYSIGFRGKWQSGSNITLQVRGQYSRFRFQESITEGKIISNQVSYGQNILKITGNIAIFDTDDFENRQYIYEKDLPYGLSVPFFHGLGTRWFLLIQLKAARNLSLWMKFAESRYFDRSHLSSGPDRIDSSKRADLSLQLHYKW
ncbi:MAG: hypothetical protein DHS20C17_20030 [Cyclobacteriaceae bacterium]|nr:MAG: hypothetical protein DHS20C17_20030 [Cyclobacteriaceae bacterium]